MKAIGELGTPKLLNRERREIREWGQIGKAEIEKAGNWAATGGNRENGGNGRLPSLFNRKERREYAGRRGNVFTRIPRTGANLDTDRGGDRSGKHDNVIFQKSEKRKSFKSENMLCRFPYKT